MALECTQHERIKRLESMLDGNGQPGLNQTVSRIDTSLTNLEKLIPELKTTVSAFNRYMIEKEAEEKKAKELRAKREKELEAEAKRKRQNQNILMTVLAMIAALIGSLFGK
jgi:septal ring factor EnvC (AmiA/AmiB activator)